MVIRRALAALSLAALALLAAAPARAQDVINKEGAALVKASFINDLDTLRGKFVGLAEAFPQDKYTWRRSRATTSSRPRSGRRAPISAPAKRRASCAC
jgi:hypothetical protein